MKVIKVELFFVDHDNVEPSGTRDAIETARYANRCISPNVLSIDWRDIGEWSDDHPLNHSTRSADEIKRLFGSSTLTTSAPPQSSERKV